MNNLLDEFGCPQYGWIKEPVSNVNYMDYPLTSVMDKPLSRAAKARKFNQFHFVGLMAEEFMAGFAIVDVKLVSNCFFYVWTKESGLIVEKSVISPVGVGTRLTSSPDQAQSSFSFLGTHVSFQQEGLETQVHAKTKVIDAQFQLTQSQGYQPLRVCSQAGYSGWVFTQKLAGLSAKGEVTVAGKTFNLDEMDVLGSVDWSCGFMRRETAWNWACFSGRDQQGRIVGLNLASGVNETGVTENGFWLEGALHKLGGVRFNFKRQDVLQAWEVTSDCGRVLLSFKPEGLRKERMNVGFMASNFKQVFGFYQGKIITDEGETIELNRVPGYAEDHYAKW